MGRMMNDKRGRSNKQHAVFGLKERNVWIYLFKCMMRRNMSAAKAQQQTNKLGNSSQKRISLKRPRKERPV
jgi:hypothetical protein